MKPAPRRPAVFLDRDGTIIIDRHYLGDPAGVELLPGAAAAITRLNAARIPVILVTSQSGIGRGYFTLEDYGRVSRRLDEVLAAEGAHLDGSYMCPHAPDADAPCACRKPGVLLYERAMHEHGLDGKRSFFIGDMWRDVAPSRAFGARGILIPTHETPAADIEIAALEAELAETLGEAVDRVLAVLAK